jgi:pilus assembly protein CpaE
MSEQPIWVKLAIRNMELRKKLEVIFRPLQEFELQRPGDNRHPGLLFFELGKDTQKELKLVHSLLHSNVVSEVFLTSANPDPKLLTQAMRSGAKEFFLQPLNEEEVGESLRRFMERREQAEKKEPIQSGKVIMVIGSKGGVGTTTVATNLAVNLVKKERDRSVALVDMNLLFGEVPLFLGIRPNYDWGEIIERSL